MYSLVKRQAEVEILPMAECQWHRRHSRSVLAAAALLSGIHLGQASGRLKTNKMYEARYSDAWMFEVARGICRLLLASAACIRSARRSLWVGAHPAVTCAHYRRAQYTEQLGDFLRRP